MQAIDALCRPETLGEGRRYLRREDTRPGPEPTFQGVTFISYCACPEFVIVQDEEGKKYRCLREEIFTINLDDLFMALAADIAHSGPGSSWQFKGHPWKKMQRCPEEIEFQYSEKIQKQLAKMI